MAPSFVQIAQIDVPSAGTSPYTVAFGSNNTVGNLLFFAMRNSTSSFVSVGDSQVNTYTQLENDANLIVFFSKNCKAGANTVTVTTGSTNCQCLIAEYSGVDLVTATDQTGTPASATSTTATTNSITTVANSELVLSIIKNTTTNTPTYTPSGGFSSTRNAGHNIDVCDFVQASAGAINMSYALGGSYAWS